MKIAVIKTGGKQYKVSEGDEVLVEKIAGKKEGDKITFDEVILASDGKETSVGSPTVSGKKVEGEIIKEGKADKVSVIRFKSKSRHRRERGHRQPFTKILIKKIS